jgi:hypothetical protein
MAATFKLEVVETKRDKWTKYVWILYVLWLLVGLYNCLNSSFEKSWSQILTPFFLLIFYILNHFFTDTNKKSFLSVDDDSVSWKFKQMPSIVKVPWAEVEWIKFEKDGISFYKASSFVDTCLTTGLFTQEQKEKLYKMITEMASEKNIRLANTTY